MSALSPVDSIQKFERGSFESEDEKFFRQIRQEKQMSVNFDLAFLAFCVAGLIGAMVGFATGAIPLTPNQH